MLALIGKLYKIERECAEKNLSYEGTQKARKKDATPVLKAIKKILDEKTDQAPPHSGIGNALKYTLRNWDGLTYYINDGRIKIDNNAAERCIKPFVIGRKNWMFNNNARGADASAVLFSIMETAKAHGVNVQKYLQFILEEMPLTKNMNKLLPSAYISASSKNNLS